MTESTESVKPNVDFSVACQKWPSNQFSIRHKLDLPLVGVTWERNSFWLTRPPPSLVDGYWNILDRRTVRFSEPIRALDRSPFLILPHHVGFHIKLIV